MIATTGPCIPHDLLEATGRHVGALPWRLDRATPRADQWLESKFPAWARSIVEDWADGRFDDLEAVVFSRGDDAAQRLYYYICELQRRGLVRGARLTVVDVAKIPRSTSEAHTIASVRRLAAEFGLDDDALEAGIAATNARRAAVPAVQPGNPACLIVGTPPPSSIHICSRSAYPSSTICSPRASSVLCAAARSASVAVPARPQARPSDTPTSSKNIGAASPPSDRMTA